MIEYKITKHYPGNTFAAPEGFHFKASHLVDGGEDSDYIIVILEGHPTQPSLVKLCNRLVQASYVDRTSPQSEPKMTSVVAAIEQELNAHGIRELA